MGSSSLVASQDPALLPLSCAARSKSKNHLPTLELRPTRARPDGSCPLRLFALMRGTSFRVMTTKPNHQPLSLTTSCEHDSPTQVKTTVVNVKHAKCDVVIGRSSIFGNPFVMPKHTRDEAVSLYKKYVWRRFREDGAFARAVMALEGKRLGCFCHPLACHGDVLVALIEFVNSPDGAKYRPLKACCAEVNGPCPTCADAVEGDDPHGLRDNTQEPLAFPRAPRLIVDNRPGATETLFVGYMFTRFGICCEASHEAYGYYAENGSFPLPLTRTTDFYWKGISWATQFTAQIAG